MFDISFMEMLIVAIAALVVLGPERLPTVARQAGQWMSRMRRYIEDVKSDFSHQIDLAELKGIKNEVEDSARSLERGLNDARSSFDTLQSSFDTSTAESLPGAEGHGTADGHVGSLEHGGTGTAGQGATQAALDHDTADSESWAYESVPDDAVTPAPERLPPTDWDKVYEDRSNKTAAYMHLWDNHLKGVLFEYLRGTANAMENLDMLQQIYYKGNNNDEIN